MTYTLWDSPQEYQIRIQKRESISGIRGRIQLLHPGQIIGEKWYEGAEVDEEEPLSDWISRT
jgi:hypothetical protein